MSPLAIVLLAVAILSRLALLIVHLHIRGIADQQNFVRWPSLARWLCWWWGCGPLFIFCTVSVSAEMRSPIFFFTVYLLFPLLSLTPRPSGCRYVCLRSILSLDRRHAGDSVGWSVWIGAAQCILCFSALYFLLAFILLVCVLTSHNSTLHLHANYAQSFCPLFSVRRFALFLSVFLLRFFFL